MLREHRRSILISVGILLFILGWVLTDPDVNLISDLPFGAGLVNLIVGLTTCTVAVTILFLSRKILIDYPVADFEKLGKRAIVDSRAAATYAMAIAIKQLGFAIVIASVFLGIKFN